MDLYHQITVHQDDKVKLEARVSELMNQLCGLQSNMEQQGREYKLGSDKVGHSIDDKLAVLNICTVLQYFNIVLL